MKTTKLLITTVLIVLNLAILFQTNRLAIAIATNEPDQRIEQCLERVGVPEGRTERIAEGVRLAANHHDLSPEFLIALAFTESSFKERAISSKNYKGYLQIPHALWEPAENFLVGARIMKEKLEMARGNVRKAIILYKGWPVDSPRGIYEANKVLRLYNRLLKA